MKLFLPLALLLAFIAPAQAVDAPAIDAAAVEKHILPAYARLTVATAALQAAADASCTDAARLQAAWREAMKAWQGAQHLRFGPSEWFDRRARFLFWPDARNVASRQLAEVFAKREAEALTSDRFVRGSIAIQGLGALERVLFDEAEFKKLLGDAYRCSWLRAVGANLAAMAKGIEADWRGPPMDFGRQFATAKGLHVNYASPSDALLELFKSLHTAIELVADHKLARPLGSSAGDAKPRLAESWRSGASLDNIRANLAAAETLYAVMSPGVADAKLDAEIKTRLAALRGTAAAIRQPLETAVAAAPARTAVERLRRDAGQLKTVLAERLTEALGLPLGFNALDGD